MSQITSKSQVSTPNVDQLLADFMLTDKDFAGVAQEWLRNHPDKVEAIEREVKELAKNGQSDWALAWSLSECIKYHKVI